jgi:hypothetical protein
MSIPSVFDKASPELERRASMRFVKYAALISAAFAAASLGTNGPGWLSGLFTLVALAFGFIFLRYRYLVETYLSILDTQEHCAAELSRLLDYKNMSEVSSIYLFLALCERGPDPDMLNFMRKVPLGDVLRLDEGAKLKLLIQKCVGYGILKPLNPQLTYPGEHKYFKVDFEPSYFSCLADEDDVVSHKGVLRRTWARIRSVS